MKKEEVFSLARSLKAEIVETHISWVLLDKKLAYKIKKPFKTNFLDFSTLAKRKEFCYKELELNNELSPDIYLDVVGIKKSKELFGLVSAREKVADYAVKMKRMDSKRQMNSMLAKGKVNETHIRNLAKEISSFHLRTAIIRTGKGAEDHINHFNDLLTVKNEMRAYLGKDVSVRTEQAAKKVNRFLKNNAGFFLERIKNEFVRDCHGDLHSGNIFLYKRPVLFDRIEFNESFRYIDILHEIGFLCMDLEAFGKKRMSNQLLGHYIKFMGIDFGEKEKSLLTYYKCYTANIRAKVNLLGAMQGSRHKKEYLSEANSYLKRMIDYAGDLD